MADKLSEIRNAQNRSLTFQERFGFLLFVSKFILSKFGLFFVFFLIHLSSRGAGVPPHRSSSQLKFPWFEQNTTESQLYNKRHLPDSFICSTEKKTKELDKIGEKFMEIVSQEVPPRAKLSPSLCVEVLPTASLVSQELSSGERIRGERPSVVGALGGLGPLPPLVFQQIRNYCIIATIVTLFLNPQQTKYFGGLAVVLKQAGFFTKYSKSEKTVYFFSWVFVILFFYSSIHLTNLIRSSYILKLAC